MKALLILSLLAASAFALRAGEAGLTRTFQPLASGEIMVEPVTCYDWQALSGLPTAIGLITAKNIPPTNAPKPVGDINVASASGLLLAFNENSAGRGIITLDCRRLHVPQQFSCTELQAVGATLECLRRTEGTKLDSMTITGRLKPNGQEAIQKLVDDFIKRPKDKPFPWE